MQILTFNCHEPYLHTLAKLGSSIDVVDGLPGRALPAWDRRARPVPPNVRLIPLEALGAVRGHDVLVAHNVSDLMLVRDRDLPRVLVLHVSLSARVVEEGTVSAAEMGDTVRRYLAAVGGVAVGVSAAKLKSWAVDGPVVEPGVDPQDYGGHTGDVPRGLRVANHVSERRERFAWSTHEALAGEVPIDLVGDNPDMEAAPARDWDHLRAILRSRRFFVHTANPALEDGYNLALLEAMATGMPIITTPSPSSPVVDARSGFVSADPARLAEGARALLADPDLARRMGEEARRTVTARFSIDRFLRRWREVLALARQRFAKRARRRADR